MQTTPCKCCGSITGRPWTGRQRRGTGPSAPKIYSPNQDNVCRVAARNPLANIHTNQASLKYVTSDHRVAGSSPTGCRSATRANLQAIQVLGFTASIPLLPRMACSIAATQSKREVFGDQWRSIRQVRFNDRLIRGTPGQPEPNPQEPLAVSGSLFEPRP